LIASDASEYFCPPSCLQVAVVGKAMPYATGQVYALVINCRGKVQE
jgi:hypothetical protein